MTDNAWSYTRNRSLRELLAGREIKHITTQPYRPQTNGKVERFHQTIGREWAYGMSYRSHRHRNKALPHWLEHYNTRRPHSGIGNRPPVSRVHYLCGQDNQGVARARFRLGKQSSTRSRTRRSQLVRSDTVAAR